MARSRKPRGQRQWHRIDSERSALGHALMTEAPSGTYVAWQDEPNGVFHLLRIDEHHQEFGPVEVPDFVVVRLVVTQADATDDGRPLDAVRIRALAASQYRRANPENGSRSFNADLKAEFLARGGIGALVGAIVGALLGGTPGILIGNTPVTSVGAHVGSIMGAATGAYVGGSKPRSANPVDRRPTPEPISRIKKRLLR